jgi:ADP-heptose:LPS heptosyltransferase
VRIATFISSGNGNAIQHIPNLKVLKQKGAKITGIFDSIYFCEELFEESDIFDQIILLKSNADLRKFTLKRKYYDKVFLASFALRRRNYKLAKYIAKEVITQHHSPNFIEKFKALPIKKAQPQFQILSELYGLKDPKPDFSFEAPQSPENYIVFHPSSGHFKTPWKIYPIKKWLEILEGIQLPIKIIGDQHEKHLISSCSQIPNAEILIGKTSVSEMKNIVSKAKFFIGHDSGPMHIAHSFGVPSFILWGGSNSEIYSYNFIKSKNYKTIELQPDCWPCASYIKANVSRVSDPDSCPDFKCIQQIDPVQVKKELTIFSENLGIQLYA